MKEKDEIELESTICMMRTAYTGWGEYSNKAPEAQCLNFNLYY